MRASVSLAPAQAWAALALRQLVEVIGVMLNAQCTSLDPEGTRRHIRAALDAGASRDEILFVLKCAALGAIHSCSLGAPILLDEAKVAGVSTASGNASGPTPCCDKMRAIGQWNAAWDPFYELDPVWTDQCFAVAVPAYASGVMSAKEVELLSVAFDASYTHLYAPGTRRHIKGALGAGATVAEIMEVLKLIGLPEALGVSPWVIIPLFWAVTILVCYWFEKKGV